MDLKFSAHTYFMMRNSNLNSVSTENQHEILNKFGKCLLSSINMLLDRLNNVAKTSEQCCITVRLQRCINVATTSLFNVVAYFIRNLKTTLVRRRMATLFRRCCNVAVLAGLDKMFRLLCR